MAGADAADVRLCSHEKKWYLLRSHRDSKEGCKAEVLCTACGNGERPAGASREQE